MTLRVHSHPLSPNGRKVVALAIELGLDHEFVLVDLLTGAHKQPGFLALNPNGKVPLIEENGWFLWESGAIMQHLADRKPEKGLYPTDAKLRADVNRWLFWDAAHLQFESAFPLYMERMFRPMMKAPPRPEVHAMAEENFKRFAAVVNGAVEGKKHLVGDRFTIADLAIVGTMMFRHPAKLDLSAAPHLAAYLDHHEQRDSWKKTAPPPMG
jgi:glutathione S-transferase